MNVLRTPNIGEMWDTTYAYCTRRCVNSQKAVAKALRRFYRATCCLFHATALAASHGPPIGAHRRGRSRDEQRGIHESPWPVTLRSGSGSTSRGSFEAFTGMPSLLRAYADKRFTQVPIRAARARWTTNTAFTRPGTRSLSWIATGFTDQVAPLHGLAAIAAFGLAALTKRVVAPPVLTADFGGRIAAVTATLSCPRRTHAVPTHADFANLATRSGTAIFGSSTAYNTITALFGDATARATTRLG